MKSCPNYFEPNNLMMGNYTDKQVNSLLSKLDDVSTDMFYSIICYDAFSLVDLGMLASLYETITAVDQSNVTEIIINIYQEQYLYLDSLEKSYRFILIHKCFLLFSTSFWTIYLIEVHINFPQEFVFVGKWVEFSWVGKHRNKLFNDSYLLQCANMYLNRC